MSARRALVAAVCLIAAGCGAAPPVAAPLPVEPAASSRATRVAAALIAAATAERAGDPGALGLAAGQLDRLGAAPLDAADQAVLARWRAALPGDAAPMRGRTLGPAYRSGKLAPGAVSELNQTFFGGRSAAIVVRTLAGPAPQVVVEDQAKRAVCRASDDPATCSWVPLYTQRHLIRIVNSGRGVSEFYIVFD